SLLVLGQGVGFIDEAMRGMQSAVGPDPLANVNRVRINTLALRARLPTMFSVREFVVAGGLMSYGANFPDLWRRAAEFVDKILTERNRLRSDQASLDAFEKRKIGSP